MKIVLKIILNNGETRSLDIQQVGEFLGSSNIRLAQLQLERDKESLVATVDADQYFPCITVDAVMQANGEKKEYYLTEADLPNLDTPFVTARMYCGGEEEADDYAAIMAYGDRMENDESRRVVYVDRQLAETRDYSEFLKEPMLTAGGSKPGTKNIREEHEYIVLASGEYLRDTQVLTDNPDNADNEDAWKDISAPLYLGLYKGENEAAAIHAAAEENILPEEILSAQEIS